PRRPRAPPAPARPGRTWDRPWPRPAWCPATRPSSGRRAPGGARSQGGPSSADEDEGIADRPRPFLRSREGPERDLGGEAPGQPRALERGGVHLDVAGPAVRADGEGDDGLARAPTLASGADVAALHRPQVAADDPGHVVATRLHRQPTPARGGRVLGLGLADV